MNLRNMTIALMAGLGYEMILKLSHIIIPSMFTISIVRDVTFVLSSIVGIIIILFLYFFYKEEKFDKRIELILKILIGCIIVNFILRLPVVERTFGYKEVRLVRDIIGFMRAILFFGFLLLYRKEIPAGAMRLMQAAVFLIVMSGIGIIKSLSILIEYTRFFMNGTATEHSQLFYDSVTILFFITHASFIYFLYCYFRLKFSKQ